MLGWLLAVCWKYCRLGARRGRGCEEVRRTVGCLLAELSALGEVRNSGLCGDCLLAVL